MEVKTEFAEFFAFALCGTDEQVQNLAHITGLKSGLDQVEFKIAAVVADFIRDKRFKDSKDDNMLQESIENELVNRGQPKKRGDYKKAQNVSVSRAVKKLLDSVGPILNQRFNELQEDGYFHKNSELTNIKKLGIWFNFVKSELNDYYRNFGDLLYIKNAKFLPEAEKYLLSIRNVGLSREP